MKKYSIISVVAGLLILAAWLLLRHGIRPSDTQFSRKVVGTWTDSVHRLALSLAPDGAYTSTFTRNGIDYEYEGTWKIEDGVVLLTLMTNNSTDTAHTMRVGTVQRFGIVHVDDHEFVYEDGGIIHTNLR